MSTRTGKARRLPKNVRKSQGHRIAHGHVGYLREAYDGEPYALEFLVPEAFESDAEIPATLLRARLAEVLRIAAKRQWAVYHRPADHDVTREALQRFAGFADLCERKERETGKPCHKRALLAMVAALAATGARGT